MANFQARLELWLGLWLTSCRCAAPPPHGATRRTNRRRFGSLWPPPPRSEILGDAALPHPTARPTQSVRTLHSRIAVARGEGGEGGLESSTFGLALRSCVPLPNRSSPTEPSRANGSWDTVRGSEGTPQGGSESAVGRGPAISHPTGPSGLSCQKYTPSSTSTLFP